MASATTSQDVRYSFEDEVTQIKLQIEAQFLQLTEYLKNRKEKLLKDLEEVQNSYKLENDKHKQITSEIERGLKSAKEIFQSSAMKDIQSAFIKSLEERQKEIESELKEKHISIEFDNRLLDLINVFGKISVDNSNDSYLPVVQYTGKVRPVVSVVTRGNGRGEFQNPWGVVVEHKSENIYVTEESNNRVQVFDREAKYLFEFGSDKMKYPLYIVIYKDRVFVTQNGGGCLLVYDFNGKFIQQVGTPGSAEGQFNNPYGITIHNTNGDIYICDYSNNRIQIFSNDYSYKSQFGMSILKYPTDIQLTKDSIFVLSHQNPFLYTFNYNLTQLHNTVCDSICKHLSNPFSFIIDGNNNFIISDSSNNNIVIFNNTGHLLHTLTDSISHPRGVCLNSNGGIIVVGYNHRLLIF